MGQAMPVASQKIQNHQIPTTNFVSYGNRNNAPHGHRPIAKHKWSSLYEVRDPIGCFAA